MNSIYTYCFSFLLLSIAQLTYGQNFALTGKIIEKRSQQAVPFATVMVMHSQTKSIITGTTSLEDGTFELSSPTDSIYIEVSFIGFSTLTINEFTVGKQGIDLGTIELSEDQETLDEVVVRAEKSQMEFKLDKRVFNVGKDLSSTGASALEVLNNVPSVEVNIEGEISLRGSAGVQILINGKPSVLTSGEGNNALGTITADMIEKVEVITNPSAKYEASGTAGIINIVMKKEEKKGLNGSISVNTGYPHNHSVGLSLNHRSKKINFFTQLGVGYKQWPRYNDNINRNDNTQTSILSNGIEYRNEIFFNGILGADYYIDANNIITVSGNFAYEIENQPSKHYFSSYQEDSLVAEWYREESTNATNPKFQYEAQYKRDFKDHKEHDLIISTLGSFFGKALLSDFSNIYTRGAAKDYYQQTRTNFREAEYTFKVDYTKPFGKYFMLEAGAQFVLFDVRNDYAVLDLVQDEWIEDATQTNIFDYNQKVLGVYTTGSYEREKWGIKLGLRVEYTNLNTLLVNSNERNTQNYVNPFPSAHVSYKFSDQFSLQAGYSRRIDRPNLWELNPFFNIRNNFSIYTGNPNLQPEFSNSYELNAIYILDKLSLNLSAYHLHTMDIVERVSTFDQNITTMMPMNVGTEWTVGSEFNFKYSPIKWFSMNGNVNYRYFIRQGTFDNNDFNFNAHRWSAQLTTKFKMPWDLEAEITGNYRSRYQTFQGEIGDNIFANIGLRKKFLKGKIVISLSVRDVFASRNRRIEVYQDGVYAYNFRQRGRFFNLGFSYGFGKGEAMEYSGRRR